MLAHGGTTSAPHGAGSGDGTVTDLQGPLTLRSRSVDDLQGSLRSRVLQVGAQSQQVMRCPQAEHASKAAAGHAAVAEVEAAAAARAATEKEEAEQQRRQQQEQQDAEKQKVERLVALQQQQQQVPADHGRDIGKSVQMNLLWGRGSDLQASALCSFCWCVCRDEVSLTGLTLR